MGRRVRIDAMALAVDGDVVVIPAEGGQVVGGVGASVASRYDVVGLEPVAAPARIDHAFAVSGQNGPT